MSNDPIPQRFTFYQPPLGEHIVWTKDAADSLVGQVVNLTLYESELVGLGRVVSAHLKGDGLEIEIERIADVGRATDD